MKILTNENLMFDMSTLPEEIDDDLRFCVLDYSNQLEVDFLFPPLYYVDHFSRPAADLKVGKYKTQVPLDWSIVISDKNLGCLEVIELKHLNDREFDAFVFNPINGYMPDFLQIEIDNIYPSMNWYMPKLKHGQLLAVPLDNCIDPPCIFIVKDTNKIPESLDITKIF